MSSFATIDKEKELFMAKIIDDKYLQIAPNKDEKIVSIYEVPTGLKCSCYCPICNEPIIAKNKNKTPNQILLPKQKIAHFAHQNSSNCKGSSESTIHLLAKEVLMKYKTLMIPPIIKNSIKLKNERKIKFENAKKEKYIITDSDKFQPDIILFKKKKQIFIEFFKTHIVDEQKIEKIKRYNVSCIEININNIEPLIDGKLNIKEIRYFLENNINYKSWILNKQTESLYAKYLESKKEIKKSPKKKKIKETKPLWTKVP